MTENLWIKYFQIFDKFDKDVISLAIFIDSDENFKPSKYEKKLYETEIIYKYKTYKVLEQKEALLKKDNNPFALVILASLYYLKAKNNQKKRFSYKIKLVELLSEKNYKEDEINDLFDFIDNLISFKSKELEKLFYEELEKMPKTKEKELIGGYKKIVKKMAIKENTIEIAKKLKLKNMKLVEISEITGLNIEELEKL